MNDVDNFPDESPKDDNVIYLDTRRHPTKTDKLLEEARGKRRAVRVGLLRPFLRP